MVYMSGFSSHNIDLHSTLEYMRQKPSTPLYQTLDSRADATWCRCKACSATIAKILASQVQRIIQNLGTFFYMKPVLDSVLFQFYNLCTSFESCPNLINSLENT